MIRSLTEGVRGDQCALVVVSYILQELLAHPGCFSSSRCKWAAFSDREGLDRYRVCSHYISCCHPFYPFMDDSDFFLLSRLFPTFP
jgi:hypothetical protein